MNHLPPVFQLPQADGEQKQFLKRQPSPRQGEGFRTFREMDILISEFNPAKLMLLP